MLVAVAMPSYKSYVQQSNRTAAINALLYLAGQEASYYSANNAYASTLADLGVGYTEPYYIPSASSPSYRMVVQGSSAAGTFVLLAVPVNNQVGDSCGIYAYDYLGTKSIYPSGTVAYSTPSGSTGSQATLTGTGVTSGTTFNTCWGN